MRKLLAAINKSQDTEIIQNAFEMREHINSENGLRETIELLENYFNLS